MIRVNAFADADGQQKRLHIHQVKQSNSVAPTIPGIAEIGPQLSVAKSKVRQLLVVELPFQS